MRPSEIYSLRWEQISLTDQGFIQVTKGKSKAARRMLPLVPAVQRSLKLDTANKAARQKAGFSQQNRNQGTLSRAAVRAISLSRELFQADCGHSVTL
jgi:integrase